MNGALGQVLGQIEHLDFSGKGEAFVESNFLTPLLQCLGYDRHKDYEVIRHGDDGSSFKLAYPPVRKGAKKVKIYSPDYFPTIRKKMFWIIEAKSPKVKHPFALKYLVQGLQYCIHPEIQAQYMLVSNGVVSSLFDAHGAVFLKKEMYEPILEFRASELVKRWPEIYELLGVEKLRGRIELDLKAAYDKLCLSSLDSGYPARLLSQVGTFSRENAQLIKSNVNRLRYERMKEDRDTWQKEIEALSAAEVCALMDDPMPGGTTQAHYFINKSFARGDAAQQVLDFLTRDYDQQSIFRKEQTFLAVCLIHLQTEDAGVMTAAKAFLDRHKDADLPVLNRVECALLRIARKTIVLQAYPKVRESITQALQSAPELVRFVSPPSAFTLTYGSEIELHHRAFEELKRLSKEELEKRLPMLLSVEATMEDEYKAARKKLSDLESQIMGFEIYGDGGRHYFFRGVLHNYGIEKRPDLPHATRFTPAKPKAVKD